jgi:kynureninase
MQISLDAARALDRADPLAALRSEFCHPATPGGEPKIYLCGHSLGLAPRSAFTRVEEELADWAQLAVEGHEHALRPWTNYADRLGRGLQALTGAHAHELVAMNSLTVNLHLMLASFYRPSGPRRRILIEGGAFSSDRHAIAAQIAWHGRSPDEDLVELGAHAGEDTLRAEDIDAAIAKLGGELALVLWPGVQFRTGQAFDCARIARAAHAAGAIAGFDHAHAIGNLPLDLRRDDADFAVWCSYKYLNGGPGAIGGAFVHERHARDPLRLRLAGWWGHDPATRFQMKPGFVPADGAASFAVSNPPILSAAPLLAALEIFERAGIERLRSKSIALNGFAEQLLDASPGTAIRVVTPKAARQRGCQLSLRLASPQASRRVFERMTELGVVGDFREPDIIRIAAVPLYNGFEDVWHGVTRLLQAERDCQP